MGLPKILSRVIEFYDRGGGDEETIPEDRIDEELVPLGLSSLEKAQLEAFLLALTDPTIEVLVPESVPSGLPPAGLELQQEGSSTASMTTGETTAGEDLAVALNITASAARVSSFPNPFNAETSIAVGLPRAAKVDLVLFDLLGRPVRRLAHGAYPAGSHVFRWDGRDDDQRPAASGVYLVRLTVQGTRRTSRLTLLR